MDIELSGTNCWVGRIWLDCDIAGLGVFIQHEAIRLILNKTQKPRIGVK
jgi:hypothetical protein